jgi:hypothetical protein
MSLINYKIETKLYTSSNLLTERIWMTTITIINTINHDEIIFHIFHSILDGVVMFFNVDCEELVSFNYEEMFNNINTFENNETDNDVKFFSFGYDSDVCPSVNIFSENNKLKIGVDTTYLSKFISFDYKQQAAKFLRDLFEKIKLGVH